MASPDVFASSGILQLIRDTTEKILEEGKEEARSLQNNANNVNSIDNNRLIEKTDVAAATITEDVEEEEEEATLPPVTAPPFLVFPVRVQNVQQEEIESEQSEGTSEVTIIE